jgi:hypothetical protein
VKRVLLPAVALGCIAALSGCNAVRPGAAATIGSDRITIDQLADQVNAVYTGTLAQQHTRPEVQLLVLDELIQSHIDDALAAKLGVTVTDNQVEAALTQAEADNNLTASGLEQMLLSGQQGAAVGYGGLNGYVRDFLIQEGIRAKLVTQERPTLVGLQDLYKADIGTYVNSDIAVIVVSSKATADSIYAKVKANPATFAAVAMAQSLDSSSKANGGDEGVKPKGTYQPALETAIYASKAGDVLGPFPLTGGAYAILHVISVTNTSFEEALPALLKAAADPTGTVAQAALKVDESSTAAKLGVWINPRFGTWGGSDALMAKAAPDLLSKPGAASSSDEAANGGVAPALAASTTP